MPRKISNRLPPIADFLFPVDPSQLSGPMVSGQGEIVALIGDRGVGCLTFVERKLEWLDDFEHFIFQVHPGAEHNAIRKASDEDIKAFRVPTWIQGEEVPICCGREMLFIGQIDDDRLCLERPADAKLWWHDAASFYLFTCSQCLECAAVGQQF